MMEQEEYLNLRMENLQYQNHDVYHITETSPYKSNPRFEPNI